MPHLPRPAADFDDWPLPEDRFLYPFWLTHPQAAKTAWSFAYEGLREVEPPDEQPLERALAAKDNQQAKKAAQRWLDDWYALPAPLAAPHRNQAFRAAKLFESGSGPSATDKFTGIMAAFAQGVPNGWAGSATATTPVNLFAEQLQATERWLHDNPHHPLADLVSFWQVRVHYFAGNNAAAWSILFKLYGRRPVRSLLEMRYFVQQGRAPSAGQLDALKDPLLAASLVAFELTPARWDRYWQLSETSRAPKAEATALQVRLLQAVVGNGDDKAALPKAFPSSAARPSQIWGELRAIVLIRRGRLQEAKEQLLMLDSDAGQAALLSNCYLAMGEPVLAARVPKLAADDAQYIMQVLVPLSEIPKLQTDRDPAIAAEAQARAAAEAIRHDDFKTAAAWYKPLDAAQGADLLQMAGLLQKKDELGLARALKARGNQLGLGMTAGYYRGFSMRYAALKPNSAEAQGLIARFEASSGGFQALRHYVVWLEGHAQAPEARAVLSEADSVYIALQSYGGWSGQFWDQYLTHHDLAVRLRGVGKQIRKR